jgi:SAM-dependent methyltransferase
MSSLYDRIGVTYTTSRRPDPRIARAIRRAVGDAASVVNVGAGAGAYEPGDVDVIAVEPSEAMSAQRRPGSARVIAASAEALPLADNSVDAAMAILTDHHWTDRPAGLRELRRVARRRVVLFNADPALAGAFWLTRDYLPAFAAIIPPAYREPGFWQHELSEILGEVRVTPVPIPHDCADGFYGAYWRRPDAYLDPRVRGNISVFRLLPEPDVDRALTRLAADLESGRWHEAYASLLDRDELDLGYRLVVACAR